MLLIWNSSYHLQKLCKSVRVQVHFFHLHTKYSVLCMKHEQIAFCSPVSHSLHHLLFSTANHALTSSILNSPSSKFLSLWHSPTLPRSASKTFPFWMLATTSECNHWSTWTRHWTGSPVIATVSCGCSCRTHGSQAHTDLLNHPALERPKPCILPILFVTWHAQLLFISFNSRVRLW